MSLKVPFSAVVDGKTMQGSLYAETEKDSQGLKLRGVTAVVDGKNYVPTVEATQKIMQSGGYDVITGAYGVFEFVRGPEDVLPRIGEGIKRLFPGTHPSFPRGLHTDGDAIRAMTSQDSNGSWKYYYEDSVVVREKK